MTIISCRNLIVSEADGYAEFTLQLNAPSTQTVSVNYSYSNAGASSSYDFVGSYGTVNFAAGTTTQTVRFTLYNDSTAETLESFRLTLSSPTNATLAADSYLATLADNDTAADSLNKANVSVRDVVVDEKAGTATFDVVLDRATTDSFSVAYATADGSATAASGDYTAASGTLTFAAGQTVQHVTVNIADDTAAEANELFYLNLGALSGNAAGAAQLADTSGQATIGSNDQTAVTTPIISASPLTVGEADGYAEFTLQLNAPATQTVSVNYNYSNAVASSSYDFVGSYGTVNFAAGTTTQTVRFALYEETTAETLESFRLTLSSPTNATLAAESYLAILADNDTAADSLNKANVSVRDVVIDEKAGTATFDVVLDRATTDSFSVAYATADGSATAASGDYTAASGTLTFAAGQTVQHVTVNIADDTAAEANELFYLNLGAPSGNAAGAAQLADASGQATVGSNDQTAVATPIISASPLTVSEADGYAEFTLQLNAPATQTVSVNYNYSNAVASSSYDFVGSYGTVNFAAGTTTQTVRFALYEDTTAESLESFRLTLSSPTNATLATDSYLAILADNDTLATSMNKANVSVRDVVIDEKAGTATFDVVLDRATTDSFSVTYATADGSATAASGDYTAASGTLTFAAGQTVQHVTVNIADDTTAEANELFYLNLGALSGNAASAAQLADASGQATIGRNDQTAIATPIISASPLTVSEADGYAEFTLQLNAPATQTVSVNYSYSNAVASSSYDFVGSYGTVKFAAGTTTQTVRFALYNDTAAESLESFHLTLSSPSNATLAAESYLAILADNDTAADSLNKANVSVRDVVVDEKAGTATFDVVLDKATTDSFSVAYATADGSATTASGDYTAASGTLTFAAGQTVQHVTVNIADDTAAEANELFYLNLGALSGNAASAAQLADASGQATIGSNDQTAVATPIISASPLAVSEADGYAEFTLQLNAPATQTVSVNYSYSNAGASSSYDFDGYPGTVNFAAGTTTQTVRFALYNDTTAESLESFRFTLSSPINATLANTDYLAVLADNDTLATSLNKANVSVRNLVVDEKAGTATFDVMLDKATTDSFSVAYATADGSATAASGDYTAASGTLTFAAGQTVQHVTVNIADDTSAEANELFYLNLGALSGNAASTAQVADASGQATIGRNDQTAIATSFISASPLVVSEADSYTDGYAEFTLQLNAPATQTVSVNYSYSSDGASSSNDFDGYSGTVNFAAGTTTQTVRFALYNDTTAESLESFRLTLSSPTNATLGNNNYLVTIADNDTMADSLSKANVSVRDVVVDEKAGTATFDVVLDKATADSFSVAYATADDSATAASGDYTAASGTLTFAAGQTVQHVTVNIADDTSAEANELFYLNLGAISGNAAGTVQVADTSGLATIGRNDQTAITTPIISASPLTVSEADGYAEFTLQLNAPSTQTVSVSYSYSSLGASSYDDFGGYSGTVNFAAGTTTQTVRFALYNDTTVEKLESFCFTLSSPTNATLANTGYLATLADNDTVADSLNKANVSVRDVAIDEKAGTATFDVVLDKATADSFSVAYATADGSATAASGDYTAASGTLTFAAGQTVQHVTVNIADDTTAEASELFYLNLGALSGNAAGTAQLADASGQATIGRNDQTAVATPIISASPLVVGEADGYAEFTLQLNAPSTQTVSVSYSYSSLGASSYDDFGGYSGTVNFAAGATTQTVRFALYNDTTVEKQESFRLTLSSPTNATLDNTSYLATLVDNDTAADSLSKASLSVRDVVVDEKAGTATFDVVLDKATSDSFSVAYATADGDNSAKAADGDYTATSGTLTFAAGQTVQHVTVNIADDTTAEASELFYLNLGALSGNAAGTVQVAEFATGTAVIGASDQDYTATPIISASNLIVSEADGYAEFSLQLNAPSTKTVSVNYSYQGSTASSYYDFGGYSGTVNFAAGTTLQTVRFDLYNDTTAESPESFNLTLSSPSNATLAQSSYSAYIIDNDSSTPVEQWGQGVDTASYAGNLAGYTIATVSPGYWTVQDNTGASETLLNVERLEFADKTVTLTVKSATAGIATSNLKTLEELYVGFFNRIPEAGGLEYWINQLKSGTTLKGIADQFYGAGVQYGVYSSNMTDADFISTAYANVLGRSGATAPGSGEISFWADRLNQGIDTKGSMVLSMIDAVHTYYTNDASWGWVAQLLDNKAAIANRFAVDYGLSYNSAQTSITEGMKMAAAITATDIQAAIALIGVVDGQISL